MGNITGINDGTETRLYTYDALNQLTSETIYANSTKIGTKVTYSYDKAGNLVSKTHSVYNNGIVSNSTTDTYTYGNSDWGDLLTAYCDNNPISRTDPQGTLWLVAVVLIVCSVIGGVVGAGIGVGTGELIVSGFGAGSTIIAGSAKVALFGSTGG
ncbi:MAG: RHS repeat protein [Clostridia bacterium]|nr:RHS repeat protein [Clostridia bacterium]